MTMAFARDSYETSNKFYAAVYENAGAPEQYHLNAYNEFATEVSKAAQWQLIKSSTPMKVVERSFVYNDDDHVTVKAKADVVLRLYLPITLCGRRTRDRVLLLFGKFIL